VSLEAFTTTSGFLRDKVILLNLLITIYMWITCAMSYYMVNLQLKYLPGNIYTNCLVSAAAEIFGIFWSGILYQKIGIKVSFTAMYIFTAIGAVMVILFGE